MGTNYSKHGIATESACNMPCSGDAGQMCGASWKSNIFELRHIDECTTNTDTCHANATCTNTVGSFTCSCNDGYGGNGITCTAICSPACVHGACILPDQCECLTGYEGSSCEIAICSPTCVHGTCVSPDQCECSPGYEGSICDIDIDECTTSTHTCHASATCTNTVGSFTCSCNDGYGGNGFTCSPICNPTCVQGTCILPDQCECFSGYEGSICEIDIDECSSGIDDCEEICTNVPGSYTCSCQAKYILEADEKSCSRCASYQTSTAFEYKFIDSVIPSDVTKFRFKVKTSNGAHLALTSTKSTLSNTYQIVIGGWGNSKSRIFPCDRHVSSCPADIEVSTPGMLNSNEHREFHVSFKDGLIEVGQSGQSPFMSHQYSTPHQINYVAYASGSESGSVNPGDWRFCSFVNFNTYTTNGILPDQRHLDVSSSTTAESVTRCASYCKMRPDCNGFSYNQSSEECELVNGETAHDSSRLVSNLNFKYYKLKVWA
ncbi:uncharacterized protein [Amphiura filiformis]|uniref:uncharacterized protein n=1 Tax=Amphiura filiformis TaxID=82378 RepID=UPI003B20D411